MIFVPFQNGRPSGKPLDVLTGFLTEKMATRCGRPVGVEMDRRGALLVADDVGNVVWRLGQQTVRSSATPLLTSRRTICRLCRLPAAC